MATTEHVVAKKVVQVTSWPPLVYFVLGVLAFVFWAAGTAVQVQTSEAWIMSAKVDAFPTLSTFGQVVDFFAGRLPASQIVPFMFAWGVQIALIIASVGVEMPKHPAWRYYLSWSVVILLIGVNSAGDFAYSSAYGFWGQTGFTLVILFVTFCMGLIAVVCFMQGFKRMSSER
jgi:hypothetical protein